jgi:hypothetical protein
MADQVFNIAKGKAAYYATLPAANDALIVVLLKATGIESDATLIDYDDLASILAASNDEADFTNYARKSLTSATVTVDDANDRVDVDIADQTWAAAGGASDNTLAKLLICYDPDTTGGTDADIIPLAHFDFAETTTGSDIVAQINAAGFFRAS